MKVYFEKSLVPCVIDDVIAWHIEHGWVWDVTATQAGELVRIGVFFCTLLCGDGAVVHFSTVQGMKIPWYVVLAAMRKGVRMVAGAVNVVYATIPEEKRKLVKVAEGLGFAAVDRYERMGTDGNGYPVVLMKYLGGRGRYINDE